MIKTMQYIGLAKLYDTLMKDVDYDAWAKHVASFMPAGASVLECACGTGEISIRLAKMGFSVTASDVSEEMLLAASQKQRAAGLSLSNLRFVRMDMRELTCHKKADCVIACCDGVNYLTSRADVKRFFASANAALKPGGLLLFDISSRYKLANVLGNNAFVDSSRETPYMWQNYYDDETKLIRMELSFFERKGGLYERFDEVHIQRAHSEREISGWLGEAGFEGRAYGFLTREAPGPEAERIQFAAVKKGEDNE